MRNLKRVLSLALAMIMVLGLMVIGSSAAEITTIDFTDKDEITYTEAVDIMVALGVLEGTDKGAFEPTSILTREQAAKIICYLLMGPDNAEKLTTNTQIFSDVAAGRWSAGYIAYCANIGILAGVGDGSFDPEGQLTGVAFGKMLLVALGYDPDIEGYVGANWATAIATDMIDAGIDVKGTTLSDPLTREQAAQMSLQTLEADMVKYSNKGTNVSTSDGTTINVGASDAEPVEIAGEGSANYAGNDPDADGYGYQQFCEKYFPDLTKTNDDSDLLGRPGYTWAFNNEDITFAAETPVVTLTTKPTATSLASTLSGYYLLGNVPVDTESDNGPATKEAKLKVNNTTKYTATVFELLVVNGADPVALTIDNQTAVAALREQLGVGRVAEVYDVDDDNVIDRIVFINYQAAQVTDVDDDEVTINFGVDNKYGEAITVTNDEDDANYDFYTALAALEVDDYLAVAVADDAETILDVAEATTVSGTLTATSTSSGTYTIGGTVYTKSVNAQSFGTIESGSTNDVVALLDANGYLIDFVEASSATGEYLYITALYTGYDSWGTTNMFQGVKTDGTVITGKVSDNSENVAEGQVVEYVYEGSTDGYKLTAYGALDEEGNGALPLAGTDSVKISSDDKKLNSTYYDSSVDFIYISGSKDTVNVTVVNGLHTATLDPANTTLILSDGYIVAVLVGKSFNAAGEDLIYVYSSAITGTATDNNGDKVNTYDAYVNGKLTTIPVDGSVNEGWNSYTIDSETGSYLLTPTNESVVDNVTNAEIVSVGSVYYLSIGSNIDSYDLSSATFVNVYGDVQADLGETDEYKITTAAKLERVINTQKKTVEIAAIYDEDAESITMIYILNVLDAQ